MSRKPKQFKYKILFVVPYSNNQKFILQGKKKNRKYLLWYPTQFLQTSVESETEKITTDIDERITKKFTYKKKIFSRVSSI